MKLNLPVKAAVTAAMLASSVGSAFAVTPAPDHFLRVGGATATNGVLFDLFLTASVGLCASSVDVYTSTDGADVQTIKNGAQTQVTCTPKTFSNPAYTALNSGSTAPNPAIGYNKESTGGSGNGTGVLASGGTLPFLTASAPTCSGSVAVGAAGGLLGYTLHTGCTAAATGVSPEVGIADVEGRLLGYTGSALTAKPLLDVVFGVPVSIPLYRALQTAQGLPTDDSCGSAPSLTRGQIAALYTGVAPTSGVFSGLPAKQMHICRRGTSSGTQAGAQAYFLSQGCSADVLAFAPPDSAGQLTNGVTWASTAGVSQTVFAGSGGGEVQACLTAFSDNPDTENNFAIGVLSTENSPLTTTNAARNKYRFIRVENALPTLQGTANGGYQYFTSNVLNVSNNIAYSPAETAIYTYWSNAAGDPAVVSPLNVPTRNGICTASGTTFGDGGVLASSGYIDAFGVPSGYTAPYDGQEVRDNALNTQSKQLVGFINNCQVPVTHPALEIEATNGAK